MIREYFVHHWVQVLILALLLLLTFPVLSPFYFLGLDGSYSWGINYLFTHDYSRLLSMTYPVGPLGILKISSTEGHNLELFILFHLLIKGLLILAGIAVIEKKDRTSIDILLSLSMLYLVCLVANIDVLIVILCFLLGMRSLESKRFLPYVGAVIFASLGLYIKSSIGLVSFMVLILVPFISYLREQDFRQAVMYCVYFALIPIVIGLFVFQFNLPLLSEFLGAIPRLSGGYSQALSLYPDNNWFALSIFFILIGSLPFLIREKNIRLYLILLALPAFAIWKHAIVREDVGHFQHLLVFTIAFSAILIIIVERTRWKTLLICVLAAMALLWNLRGIDSEYRYTIDFSKLNNVQVLFDLDSFKKTQSAITASNFEPHTLDSEVRGLIGEKTVDIYPFAHSYAAINKLNWSPRKTLEIGASTSAWASSIAAQHYQVNGPDIVLLHLLDDNQGGRLGSLDNRHLLNDEPKLIRNLLSNYKIIHKAEDFILFEERKESILNGSEEGAIVTIEYGEWIDVPHPKDSAIRLKVSVASTTLGRVKDFLYKGERYFIDYSLSNGEVLTYRFMPSTARLGLWCHPWIQDPSTDWIEASVERVRIRAEDSRFVQPRLEYSFEYLKLASESSKQSVYSLFDKHTKAVDSLLTHFTSVEPSGSEGFMHLEPDEFSKSWTLSLDSLWSQLDPRVTSIGIHGRVRCQGGLGRGDLVVSTKGARKDMWVSTKTGSMASDGTWSDYTIHYRLTRNLQDSGTLSMYLWNSSEFTLNFDDLVYDVRAMVPVD